MQRIVLVFCLCVCFCCLRVIVLDKRTCGQGWTGGGGVRSPPPSVCFWIMRLITLIPLLLILVLALAPTTQLGSTWGLPPLLLWTHQPMRHDHQSIDFDFTNIHYQRRLPLGNPTGTFGGLLRVGWKSLRHTDLNVNYLLPSALGVPKHLQRVQV